MRVATANRPIAKWKTLAYNASAYGAVKDITDMEKRRAGHEV